MLSYVKPLPEWYNSDAINREIRLEPELPEHLYHVILAISHLSKDPSSQIEMLRVSGTYTSLSAAKAAAHRVLFEGGYEGEMFQVYETEYKLSERDQGKRTPTGLVVHAEAEDGTNFDVCVLTTPNDLNMMTVSEEGRVLQDLYHVMQTGVLYGEDVCRSEREHNIQGSFLTYQDASERARQILLDANDGVSKESYAQYDEAGPGEKDCGYGENVLVHAVGTNGENILISVVLGQVLESARLAEAAMRIR
jgi:hypothetical protein